MYRPVIARQMRINQQDCFDGVKFLMEGTSTSKLNYSENKLLSFSEAKGYFNISILVLSRRQEGENLACRNKSRLPGNRVLSENYAQ